MKLARLAFDGLCYMGLACAGLIIFTIGVATFPYWAWRFWRDEVRGKRELERQLLRGGYYDHP